MAAVMPRQPRLPILFVLVCALFLRVLVPAGWMPVENAGAFAIEPCPAADVVQTIHAGMHHAGGNAGHHSGHGDQHNGDCAFSPIHAGFTPAAQPPIILGPIVAAPLLKSRPFVSFFATGPPALPPPARGPPAIA